MPSLLLVLHWVTIVSTILRVNYKNMDDQSQMENELTTRRPNFFRPHGRVIDRPMGLREEKKAEQRRAILDTAIALFRERGYEQTRVQDIIQRSRISEATFFNYFPKKDALIFEIAIDQLDSTIAAATELLNRNDTGVPARLRHL